eukprot:g1281.t1
MTHDVDVTALVSDILTELIKNHTHTRLYGQYYWKEKIWCVGVGEALELASTAITPKNAMALLALTDVLRNFIWNCCSVKSHEDLDYPGDVPGDVQHFVGGIVRVYHACIVAFAKDSNCEIARKAVFGLHSLLYGHHSAVYTTKRSRHRDSLMTNRDKVSGAEVKLPQNISIGTIVTTRTRKRRLEMALDMVRRTNKSTAHHCEFREWFRGALWAKACNTSSSSARASVRWVSLRQRVLKFVFDASNNCEDLLDVCEVWIRDCPLSKPFSSEIDALAALFDVISASAANRCRHASTFMLCREGAKKEEGDVERYDRCFDLLGRLLDAIESKDATYLVLIRERRAVLESAMLAVAVLASCGQAHVVCNLMVYVSMRLFRYAHSTYEDTSDENRTYVEYQLSFALESILYFVFGTNTADFTQTCGEGREEPRVVNSHIFRLADEFAVRTGEAGFLPRHLPFDSLTLCEGRALEAGRPNSPKELIRWILASAAKKDSFLRQIFALANQGAIFATRANSNRSNCWMLYKLLEFFPTSTFANASDRLKREESREASEVLRNGVLSTFSKFHVGIIVNIADKGFDNDTHDNSFRNFLRYFIEAFDTNEMQWCCVRRIVSVRFDEPLLSEWNWSMSKPTFYTLRAVLLKRFETCVETRDAHGDPLIQGLWFSLLGSFRRELVVSSTKKIKKKRKCSFGVVRSEHEEATPLDLSLDHVLFFLFIFRFCGVDMRSDILGHLMHILTEGSIQTMESHRVLWSRLFQIVEFVMKKFDDAIDIDDEDIHIITTRVIENKIVTKLSCAEGTSREQQNEMSKDEAESGAVRSLLALGGISSRGDAKRSVACASLPIHPFEQFEILPSFARGVCRRSKETMTAVVERCHDDVISTLASFLENVAITCPRNPYDSDHLAYSVVLCGRLLALVMASGSKKIATTKDTAMNVMSDRPFISLMYSSVSFGGDGEWTDSSKSFLTSISSLRALWNIIDDEKSDPVYPKDESATRQVEDLEIRIFGSRYDVSNQSLLDRVCALEESVRGERSEDEGLIARLRVITNIVYGQAADEVVQFRLRWRCIEWDTGIQIAERCFANDGSFDDGVRKEIVSKYLDVLVDAFIFFADACCKWTLYRVARIVSMARNLDQSTATTRSERRKRPNPPDLSLLHIIMHCGVSVSAAKNVVASYVASEAGDAGNADDKKNDTLQFLVRLLVRVVSQTPAPAVVLKHRAFSLIIDLLDVRVSSGNASQSSLQQSHKREVYRSTQKAFRDLPENDLRIFVSSALNHASIDGSSPSEAISEARRMAAVASTCLRCFVAAAASNSIVSESGESWNLFRVFLSLSPFESWRLPDVRRCELWCDIVRNYISANSNAIRIVIPSLVDAMKRCDTLADPIESAEEDRVRASECDKKKKSGGVLETTKRARIRADRLSILRVIFDLFQSIVLSFFSEKRRITLATMMKRSSDDTYDGDGICVKREDAKELWLDVDRLSSFWGREANESIDICRCFDDNIPSPLDQREQRPCDRLCTHHFTGSQYVEQHWYQCYTCGLTDNKGCCSICAETCHKGHDVVYAKKSRFFCDCGSQKNSTHSCVAASSRRNRDSSSSFRTSTERPSQIAKTMHAVWSKLSTGGTLEDVGGATHLACAVPNKSLINAVMNEIKTIDALSFLRSTFVDLQQCLIREFQDDVRALEERAVSTGSSRERHSQMSSRFFDSFVSETSKPVVVQSSQSDSIARLYKASKHGVFSCTKSNSLTPSFRLKAAAFDLHRHILALSKCGLALVLEGRRVVVVNATPLVTRESKKDLPLPTRRSDGTRCAESSSSSRTSSRSGASANAHVRVTLSKVEIPILSSTVVDFEPLRVVIHPTSSARCLVAAVVGIFDCEMFVFDSHGKVAKRLMLQLMLNSQNMHIKDVQWISSSEVNGLRLLVATNRSVIIYEPCSCTMSPTLTFLLPKSASRKETIQCVSWASSSGESMLFVGTNRRLFASKFDAKTTSRSTDAMTRIDLKQEIATLGEKEKSKEKVVSYVSLCFVAPNLLFFSTKSNISGVVCFEATSHFNVEKRILLHDSRKGLLCDVDAPLYRWKQISSKHDLTMMSVPMNRDGRCRSVIIFQFSEDRALSQVLKLPSINSVDSIVGIDVRTASFSSQDTKRCETSDLCFASSALVLLDSGALHSLFLHDNSVAIGSSSDRSSKLTSSNLGNTTSIESTDNTRGDGAFGFLAHLFSGSFEDESGSGASSPVSDLSDAPSPIFGGVGAPSTFDPIHTTGSVRRFEDFVKVTSDRSRASSYFVLSGDALRDISNEDAWKRLNPRNSSMSITSQSSGKLKLIIYQRHFDHSLAGVRLQVGSTSYSSMPDTISILGRRAVKVSRGHKTRWFSLQLSLAEQAHVASTGTLKIDLSRSSLSSGRIVLKSLEIFCVSRHNIQRRLVVCEANNSSIESDEVDAEKNVIADRCRAIVELKSTLPKVASSIVALELLFFAAKRRSRQVSMAKTDQARAQRLLETIGDSCTTLQVTSNRREWCILDRSIAAISRMLGFQGASLARASIALHVRRVQRIGALFQGGPLDAPTKNARSPFLISHWIAALSNTFLAIGSLRLDNTDGPERILTNTSDKYMFSAIVQDTVRSFRAAAAGDLSKSIVASRNVALFVTQSFLMRLLHCDSSVSDEQVDTSSIESSFCNLLVSSSENVRSNVACAIKALISLVESHSRECEVHVGDISGNATDTTSSMRSQSAPSLTKKNSSITTIRSKCTMCSKSYDSKVSNDNTWWRCLSCDEYIVCESCFVQVEMTRTKPHDSSHQVCRVDLVRNSPSRCDDASSTPRATSDSMETEGVVERIERIWKPLQKLFHVLVRAFPRSIRNVSRGIEIISCVDVLVSIVERMPSFENGSEPTHARSALFDMFVQVLSAISSETDEDGTSTKTTRTIQIALVLVNSIRKLLKQRSVFRSNQIAALMNVIHAYATRSIDMLAEGYRTNFDAISSFSRSLSVHASKWTSWINASKGDEPVWIRLLHHVSDAFHTNRNSNMLLCASLLNACMLCASSAYSTRLRRNGTPVKLWKRIKSKWIDTLFESIQTCLSIECEYDGEENRELLGITLYRIKSTLATFYESRSCLAKAVNFSSFAAYVHALQETFDSSSRFEHVSYEARTQYLVNMNKIVQIARNYSQDWQDFALTPLDLALDPNRREALLESLSTTKSKMRERTKCTFDILHWHVREGRGLPLERSIELLSLATREGRNVDLSPYFESECKFLVNIAQTYLLNCRAKPDAAKCVGMLFRSIWSQAHACTDKRREMARCVTLLLREASVAGANGIYLFEVGEVIVRDLCASSSRRDRAMAKHGGQQLRENLILSALQHLERTMHQITSDSNDHTFKLAKERIKSYGLSLEPQPCLRCIPPSSARVLQIGDDIGDVRWGAQSLYTRLHEPVLVREICLVVRQRSRAGNATPHNRELPTKATLHIYRGNSMSLTDLKDRRDLWEKVHVFEPTAQKNGEELWVPLPIPVLATHLWIQYSDFDSSVVDFASTLACPRCGSTVDNKHGHCSSCNEVALQCRSCRNINYDKLDAFLCVQCGYCRFAALDVRLKATTAVWIDDISSEEEREEIVRRLDAISDESLAKQNELQKCLVALVEKLDSFADCRENEGKPAVRRAAMSYNERHKKASGSLIELFTKARAYRQALCRFSDHDETPRMSCRAFGGDACYTCRRDFLKFALRFFERLTMAAHSRNVLLRVTSRSCALVTTLFCSATTTAIDKARREIATNALCSLCSDSDSTLYQVLTVIKGLCDGALNRRSFLGVQCLLQLTRCALESNDTSPSKTRTSLSKMVGPIFECTIAILVRCGRSSLNDPSVSKEIVEPCLLALTRLVVERPLSKCVFEGRDGGTARAIREILARAIVTLNSFVAQSSSARVRSAALALFKTMLATDASVGILEIIASSTGFVDATEENFGRLVEVMDLTVDALRTNVPLRFRFVAQGFLGSLVNRISHIMEAIARCEQVWGGGQTSSCQSVSAQVVLESILLNARSEEDSRTSPGEGRIIVVSAFAILKDLYAREDQQHVNSYDQRVCLECLKQIETCVFPKPRKMSFEILLERVESQEDFFRGPLPKNPLAIDDILVAADDDVSPRLSDLRKKIAGDLGLHEPSLLELLVCGNIVAIELSLEDVYTMLWLPHIREYGDEDLDEGDEVDLDEDGGIDESRLAKLPMRVTYRLVGIDGDATEPMINSLTLELQASQEENGEKDSDKEIMWERRIGYFGSCGGLALLFQLLTSNGPQNCRNQIGRQIVRTAVRLLGFCCRVKAICREMIRLDAADTLLQCCIASFSLDSASTIARELLLIIEALIMQSSTDSCMFKGDLSGPSFSPSRVFSAPRSHLTTLLEKLSTIETLPSNSKLSRAMARVLPYLTYGRPELLDCFVLHFEPYLKCDEIDTGKREFYRSLFLRSLRFLGEDNNGGKRSSSSRTSSKSEIDRKLKSTLVRRGLVKHCADVLQNAPHSSEGTKDEFEGSSWQSFIRRPSLALALEFLGAASSGKGSEVQRILLDSDCLECIDRLERCGVEPVNTLAERLIECLQRGDDVISKAIANIKGARQKRLRALAEAKRKQILAKMGLRVTKSGGGHGGSTIMKILANQSLLDDMTSSEEEEDSDEGEKEDDASSDLRCVVCHEGYEDQASEPLGVYTLTKVVPLRDNVAAFDSQSLVFTTVSSYNPIHVACHRNAARADRSMRPPKSEWEGAELRNSRTRCNGLMPIRSCASNMSNSDFESCVDAYFSSLSSCTFRHASTATTRLYFLLHDIKYLLLRISFREMLSEDSRGGSVETNLTFLLASLHLATFVWDISSNEEKRKHRASFQKYMRNCRGAEKKRKKSKRKEVDEEDDDSSEACYMAIVSLLVESPDEWIKSKMTFVRRLLSCATLRTTQQGSGARRCRRRVRNLSNAGDDAASSALFVGGRGSRSSTPSCSPALRALKTAPVPAQGFLSFLSIVDFIQLSTKSSVETWEASFRTALGRAVSDPKDTARAPLLAFCQNEVHLPGMQNPDEVDFLFQILRVDGKPE